MQLNIFLSRKCIYYYTLLKKKRRHKKKKLPRARTAGVTGQPIEQYARVFFNLRAKMFEMRPEIKSDMSFT